MPRPSPMPRPYGSAPWNRPVAGLPLHPDSSVYSSRMWNLAPDSPGNFNLRFNTFTYPVFYSSDATGDFVVATGTAGNMAGNSMPWNPAWSNAVDTEIGSDAQIIVIDEANNREYNLWQVRTWNGSQIQASRCTLVQTGTVLSSGSPANYLTKENGWQPSRGVGIQYLAMLVRPEEIIAGEILHALSMPITHSGNHFVAPGTKTDGGTNDDPITGTGIPEGMRFAINKTDAQIETWVASKASAYRNLGRTVARCLRDYGWIISDTSGAAGWQCECYITSTGLWGASVDPLSSTATNLMDGLFVQSDIYALVPSDQYPAVGGGGTPTDQKTQRGLLAGVNRGVLRGVVG